VDAERWIGQIHGVLQCKIDLDAEGEVTGVHVVTGMEREPRHIVRDVEGLLKARLGLNVFYKKIGVVQVVDKDLESTEEIEEASAEELADLDLFEAEEPTSAVLLEEVQAPRIQCSGVGVLSADTTVRAEVDLLAGAVEARGVAEGPNRVDSEIDLIARATVDAVRQLVYEPLLLDLTEARVADMAGQSVVLVALELVEGRRSERLFGTCPAQHNRQQAVVYAILDALNRRLSLLEIKTGEVAG
jgi:hypothetical protein